ncbi:glutamate receptor 2-like [Glandiceps talaboti]
MTKVVSPSMPQSFDELSRQTKIKYSAITGGSTQAFFRYSQIGVYQRMWSFMESNPTSSVWTTKEGVEKVLESNGKYAFIGEGTTLQHIANKDCDLYVMPGTINLKSFGLAFPKNDSRTDSFSRALLELREDGTLDMLYEKWWRGSGLCRDASIFDSDVGQSTQYASAISLTNLSGAFIILLIGIILSIPLLLCEWVVYKQKSKKRDVPETRTDSEGQSGTASAAV